MRLRWAIAALICIGAAIWMLVILQNNVVLFEPVSDAVAARDEQGDRALKMSGLVVPGSIREADDDVRFELTEGGVNARVSFSGSPPDLFSDCAPVVVEGRWHESTFVSDELLIKHGSDYEPLKGEMGEQCPEEPEGVR
ncbi:MAG: cytochrome c maturation protein CcmE [Acidimicrobiia bacterium]|jgi:cytochrome c-type biogenesis protein CcmE